jgi:hypothetical protein
MARDVFRPRWEPPYQAGELSTGIPEVGATYGDIIARRASLTGSGAVATTVSTEVDRNIVEAIDQNPPRPKSQL